MWNEERCSETLNLAPTPPNMKYAARLAETIKRAIEQGSFRYADFFPDSPRAKTGPQAIVTVEAQGEKWLRSKGRLSSATRSQYDNALKFWYSKLGRDKDILKITHGDLAAEIGDHDWPSAKLCNNYLIPLRGLFALSVRDKVLPDNPMDGIGNMALQAPLPDPFTLDEAEAILADLFKHYPETIGNYFEVAFFAGPRPEEEIALMWRDVDWPLESVRIERARSFRGELKSVKGYSARDVEFAARAMAALKRQKPYTFMKSHGFIFENHVTARPFHDERSQRDHYWTPALKRLGIRYRRPYCTRHTFATALIMSGCNVSWLARQMGNSPRVIYKHYAKWIEGADRGRERAKQDEAFTRFGPDLDQTIKNTGRRDWSRTITPRKPTGTDGNDSE
jgi:integrase